MINFIKNKFLLKNGKKKKIDIFLFYSFGLLFLLILIIFLSFSFLLNRIEIVFQPAELKEEDIPSFNMEKFEKIQQTW